MMTIDLEKKLLKQKKIEIPEELLAVKEYEKLEANQTDLDVLRRVGVDSNIVKGKNYKKKVRANWELTKQFDHNRVFHISQIESTCNKYYLRFLPSYFFKGSLDDKLGLRISTFETAHGVTCRSNDIYGNSAKDDNTFIMAPATSFKLEEKPKDPLFFYKINEEYYYLIHKWGNDLSIFNRIKSLYTSTWLSTITLALVLTALCYMLIPTRPDVYLIIPVIAFLFAGLMYGVSGGEWQLRFYDKNKWDSKIKS